MPKIRALKEVKYAGSLRRPGDVFEATDREAKLLAAIKKAELVAEEDRPRRGRPPKVREPEPAAADDAGQAEDADKPKRGRYARRDLTADE